MVESILQINKLNKSYGKQQVLDDVSFKIGPGEIVGLLGHNGAGKSTLIKCLMGVIESYSGEISVCDKNVKNNHECIMKNIGVLLEPSFCEYLTAKKNLELLSSLSDEFDNERIDAVLEMVSLKRSAYKKVGEFSFGMKQRLGLAQVLLLNPKLIVLDEPMVGLDPLGIEIIKNVIVDCSKNNVAVLFSSHQINDVFDICDRAVVLNEGKIVYDDSVSKLIKRNYILQVDCDCSLHKEELIRILPGCLIDGGKIIFNDSEKINEILHLFIMKDIKIIDFSCENNMDNLKKLMQQ
ncbi:MAG: ABC transporter ATP-binding protein [Lachnospira sp.]